MYATSGLKYVTNVKNCVNNRFNIVLYHFLKYVKLNSDTTNPQKELKGNSELKQQKT